MIHLLLTIASSTGSGSITLPHWSLKGVLPSRCFGTAGRGKRFKIDRDYYRTTGLHQGLARKKVMVVQMSDKYQFWLLNIFIPTLYSTIVWEKLTVGNFMSWKALLSFLDS